MTQSPRPALAISIALLLLALAAFAGYHQIFSTYAVYDDEGYVMVSLASYMRGLPLYDETYTQYGPAFFQLNGAWHRLTGLPITHDVTRLQTLVLWLVAAGLCGLAVRRMTTSPWAGLAGGLAVFFHLERLALEPGHPQELAVLAVATVLVLGSRLDRVGRPAALYGAMGVVVGVMVLTKLNVGVLLLLPLGLTFVIMLDSNHRRIVRSIRPLALAGGVAFPFLLALEASIRLDGLVLPAVVSLSIAALVWRSLALATPVFSWRDAGWFAVGGVGTVCVSLGLALLEGTTPGGLAYGLVGQHRSLIETFFIPVPLHGIVVLWAVLAATAAWVAHRRPAVIPIGQLVLVGALLYSCLRYAAETAQPLIHGLNDRGGAAVLIGAAAPALWVLLGRTASASMPSRLLIGLVAAVQPLGAYPVPGTQTAVGTMAIVVACTVALHDGVWLQGDWLIRRRPAIVAVLLVLVGVLLLRDVQLYQRRATLTPLGLPGASRVRMEPEQVEELTWLVRTLRARSDTFVFGRHAQNSLYFWTELEPPTGLNATFWPFLLSRDEQRRVVAALEDENAGRVAVVQTPFDVALPDDSPLLEHIATCFGPVETRGQFEVWLRNF